MGFDFDTEVKNGYIATVIVMNLKDVYNSGKSQQSTTGPGIYALFLNGKLKKNR